MRIDYKLLKSETERLLEERGVKPLTAAIVGEVILYADLAGRTTHGLARLGYYLKRIDDGLIDVDAIGTIDKYGRNYMTMNGNNGLGQDVAFSAMSGAIERADKHDIGVVCVRNSSHFGAAGYYSLMAVNSGMVGITFTNARPSVGPCGSIPLLGTNPYAIGFPSDTDYPFLIDCATSVLQRGDLENMDPEDRISGTDVSLYYTKEQIDRRESRPHTVENVLKELTAGTAALNTIGHHKGFGLSIAIELFCSAFIGGDFMSDLNGHYEGEEGKKYNIGHFFMAIKPDMFTPFSRFKKNVGNVIREIKEEGCRVPGEESHKKTIDYKKNGVELKDKLVDELKALGMQI